MRRILGFVVIAAISFTACGSSETSKVAPAIIEEATTTSAPTTTIAPATTASTTTSTETPTTTQPITTLAQVTEEIAFENEQNLAGCNFNLQPNPTDQGVRMVIESVNDIADLDTTLLLGLTEEMSAPAVCVGSAELGSAGITVIAGHRTTHGGPFRYLPKLVVGDSITITLADGTPLIYRVSEVSSEPTPKEEAFKELQGGSTVNELRIFTCGPEEGQDSHRWIISAKLVG